jgi:uncharacterized membrane protein YfhO
VLSDAWFPGWKATIDGSAATIQEVDGGVRGVVAAQGTHVIEMKYRPASVFAGGFLTFFAAFAAAGAGFSVWRRR